MTMDELRRQLATTKWPLVLRVDGKDIPVQSRKELMVPSAGNLICVYEEGAFEVIDCQHIATLHRTRSRASADYVKQSDSAKCLDIIQWLAMLNCGSEARQAAEPSDGSDCGSIT